MTQDPMRQRFRNIQVPGATQPGQATKSSAPTVSRSDDKTTEVVAEEKPHRLTVYMPRPLFKLFKHHSIDIERDMSEIVVELVEAYMQQQVGES